MATFQFDKKLKALEEIVDSMEQENQSLEKSITQFEKGVKIIKECQKALAEAEQKVSILKNDSLEEFSPGE